MRCKRHALGHCVRSGVPFDFRRSRAFPARPRKVIRVACPRSPLHFGIRRSFCLCEEVRRKRSARGTVFRGTVSSRARARRARLRNFNKASYVRDMRSRDTRHFGFCGDFRRKPQTQKTQKILTCIQKPPPKRGGFLLCPPAKRNLFQTLSFYTRLTERN